MADMDTRVRQDAAAVGAGERAYNAIRQRILDNVWPPGLQVLEQAIADEIGVSRTPVRQALVRLEAEGLLHIVPRHGMRVAALAPRDMREIYEVLQALEPFAAGLLARRRPARDELAPLDAACARMERALEAADRSTWAEGDAAFHLGLAALCGNARLGASIREMWIQSRRARLFTLTLRPLPAASTQEHRATLEAIAAHDAEAAQRLFLRHRERAASELMALVERYNLDRL